MIAPIRAGIHSLAVSLGIAAAVAAGLAVVKRLWDAPSPAERRQKFLAVVGQSQDVPREIFLAFHEADDPIGDAVVMLRTPLSDGMTAALRAALTAAA